MVISFAYMAYIMDFPICVISADRGLKRIPDSQCWFPRLATEMPLNMAAILFPVGGKFS
jgi:hypothetical protein